MVDFVVLRKTNWTENRNCKVTRRLLSSLCCCLKKAKEFEFNTERNWTESTLNMNWSFEIYYGMVIMKRFWLQTNMHMHSQAHALSTCTLYPYHNPTRTSMRTKDVTSAKLTTIFVSNMFTLTTTVKLNETEWNWYFDPQNLYGSHWKLMGKVKNKTKTLHFFGFICFVQKKF